MGHMSSEPTRLSFLSYTHVADGNGWDGVPYLPTTYFSDIVYFPCLRSSQLSFPMHNSAIVVAGLNFCGAVSKSWKWWTWTFRALAAHYLLSTLDSLQSTPCHFAFAFAFAFLSTICVMVRHLQFIWPDHHCLCSRASPTDLWNHHIRTSFIRDPLTHPFLAWPSARYNSPYSYKRTL